MLFAYDFLEEIFHSEKVLYRMTNVFGSLIIGFGVYIGMAFPIGILSRKLLTGLIKR